MWNHANRSNLPAPGQTQGVVQPPRHPHQDYFDEYYSTWDNYAENRDGAILKIMNGVAPTSGRKGKPKRINLDRLRRLKKDLDLYTRDDDLSKKRARLNRLDQDQIVESNHYDLVVTDLIGCLNRLLQFIDLYYSWYPEEASKIIMPAWNNDHLLDLLKPSYTGLHFNKTLTAIETEEDHENFIISRELAASLNELFKPTGTKRR